MILTRGCDHQMHSEFVEVGGYRPGFFARLFGLPIIKARLVPNQYRSNPNATTYCFIDFEDSPCELNKPYHQNVVFGNELYSGITPILHHHDNIYKCKVQSIEIVRVEKGYEPLDCFYR